MTSQGKLPQEMGQFISSLPPLKQVPTDLTAFLKLFGSFTPLELSNNNFMNFERSTKMVTEIIRKLGARAPNVQYLMQAWVEYNPDNPNAALTAFLGGKIEKNISQALFGEIRAIFKKVMENEKIAELQPYRPVSRQSDRQQMSKY